MPSSKDYYGKLLDFYEHGTLEAGQVLRILGFGPDTLNAAAQVLQDSDADPVALRLLQACLKDYPSPSPSSSAEGNPS